MSKCKSILCTKPALPHYDFCGDCIDQYILAILAGNMRASEDEEDTDEVDEEYEYQSMAEQYPQYYKDVSDLAVIDVYKVHQLFNVDDPSGALQHASKKLLLSGVRTGGKSQYDDIREARDTLTRWLDIYAAE